MTAELEPDDRKVGEVAPEIRAGRIDDLPALVRLPTVIPAAPSGRGRRRWLGRVALVLALIGAGATGWHYWQQRSGSALPPGFAMGNGRLEADEVDVNTKFPARIEQLLVDEGDIVKAGQVVARMNTADLQAQLAKAEAQALQAERALQASRHALDQQRAQLTLAGQQLDRSRVLLQRDFASKEVVDQRQAQLDGARASFNATEAQVGALEHALEAARQDAALIAINIADSTLIAPKDGRVQYRLANLGEMMPAGAKVFTLLDTGYVYMDVFLPTAEAGRVRLGADARILLDARPDLPLPAKVAFLAARAQFTPKAVETRDERDKLMFRVRVKIDPDLLRAHAEAVRSGLPGIAYVRLDPKADWPGFLRGRLAP
jgi:HlyD family secretion protein